MANDSPPMGPTPDELTHWIELSAESDFIDAKAPMAWDGADASASLTKHIAAFANSRDGGVIVIGKAESHDGRYRLQGVTAEQSASFDTTVVANWVNARFSPPIRLACFRQELDGKLFIVIVVREFDDVPILCTRSVQETGNPKNHLLREGAIYIRGQNAESKTLMTADELRGLIGLATRKRGDELLSHFEAMLKGRSLADLRQVPDPFVHAIEQVRRDLNFDLSKGGWWMAFHPERYVGDRWETSDELERLVATHSLRIYDEFPGQRKGTVSMGWGIANELYGETWALTKSGLFCYWKKFRENRETAANTGYRGGDEAREPIPAGEWIEFTWAVQTLVNFLHFLSRFVAVYDAGERIDVSIDVGPLAGRKLVANFDRILMGVGAPEPCRAPHFTFDKTVDAESLRTGWEAVCADALRRLFELFPDHRIPTDALLKWVERFKTRGL